MHDNSVMAVVLQYFSAKHCQGVADRTIQDFSSSLFRGRGGPGGPGGNKSYGKWRHLTLILPTQVMLIVTLCQS